MWSHSPHHTYASCGKILDLSTSFIWRYLKILPTWRNIRFLHIYHAKNLKFLHMTNFSPHIQLVILVTNIRYAWLILTLQDGDDDLLHIYHAKKSEISPHDKLFSTCLAGDTSSTVKKMRKFYATKNFLTNQFSALAFTFTFLSTFSFNLKTISSNFSSTKLHTALSTWSYTLDILAIYRDYL